MQHSIFSIITRLLPNKLNASIRLHSIRPTLNLKGETRSDSAKLYKTSKWKTTIYCVVFVRRRKWVVVVLRGRGYHSAAINSCILVSRDGGRTNPRFCIVLLSLLTLFSSLPKLAWSPASLGSGCFIKELSFWSDCNVQLAFKFSRFFACKHDWRQSLKKQCSAP